MFKIFIIALLALLHFNSYASELTTTPPDTTTNLVDKSASLFILEEAKKEYVAGHYLNALVKFREAGNKDPNSWRPPYWISNCHYNLDNYGYAMQYAKQAVSLGAEDKDVYVLLGTCYHRLNKLDSAIYYYEIAKNNLSTTKIKELRIDEKISKCNFAKAEFAKQPERILVQMPRGINSGYNDYAPVITDGGKTLYFASRRSDTKGGRSNPDDDLFFEDIYRATWDEESQMWDSITNNLDKLNSDYFEAFSHITADGLFGYVTLNSEETNGSDICETNFTDKGRWNTPKPIKNKSINTSYFDACATVTADGNTMYFVSDRNGLKKGTDIFVVRKEGKSWGTAVPVSDSINSTEDETTPFITPDGRYLFFSSKGHLGLGGYDVFVSENMGTTWSKPINLGASFNSVNNDTHFQYYPSLKKAFLSSFNLVGQKASMDIYEVDMSNFKFPKSK